MVVILLFTVASVSFAGGKVGLYGIRMVPYGDDAEDYSQTSWGMGLHVVAPVPQLWNFLAGVGGIEYVNMLSDSTDFPDRITGLMVEQRTKQHYLRFFIGSQVGGHGNGFIRPHAGVNLALIYYGISTHVAVPDDFDREKEIRQSLRDEGHMVFGYDITLGVDLNFSNTIALDGGVRYLKSFSLPQQLGDDSVTIHPQYFQIYIGVGASFNVFRE
jgi:hypothetical protein